MKMGEPINSKRGDVKFRAEGFRKRLVILTLVMYAVAVVSLPLTGSDRLVATVEVPNVGAGFGLFLSPKGELVIGDNHSIVTIDSEGARRTLVTDTMPLYPLASCGNRGFIVQEFARPSVLRFIDWKGRTQWRFPKDSSRVEVSPGGFICFPAAVSNLFLLRPDGSVSWSVPIESGAPWWSGFRFGSDDSVAFTLPISKKLVVMGADGTELWSQPAPWMDRGLFISRDAEAGVVLGGTNRLAAFTAEGLKRWEIPFPPKASTGIKLPPGNGSSPATLTGIALDQRGFVYCQASDDLVYVLNDHGVLQRAIPRPANYSRQDECIAFTASGDAIFNTGEYQAIKPSFRVNGRPSTEYVETSRRLVCLAPDGKQRWDVQLPGHSKWERPKSMKEMKYLLDTRMGSREMIWTRQPLVAPDGTIFLWHAISGRQEAWTYIIRGDQPSRR